MKILDVIEEGEFYRFVTDNSDRPEFVYKKDKYSDLDGFEREIGRSISFQVKKKDKLKSKVNKFKSEIENSGKILYNGVLMTTEEALALEDSGVNDNA